MILLVFLVGWVGIYLVSRVIPLARYGVEVTPLYLLYRTKRLNNFLRATADKWRRFWRVYADVGVLAAVFEMAIVFYYLINNLLRFVYAPQQAEPIVPFLPGVTISLRWVPYILVAIGLALTTHELAHGVIAYLEQIPVKSSGLVLAPITFGGFVEPDEEVFEQSEPRSKLRVLAAGSMTNMLGGLLAMLLILAIFSPASGVLVLSVSDGYPAHEAGIRPWNVITSINGTRVTNLLDFIIVMDGVTPGAYLAITTVRDSYLVETVSSPDNASRAIIGLPAGGYVSYVPMRIGESYSQVAYHLNLTLNWMSTLMISLAIFNMLPLFPFDGERYLYTLLQLKLKRGLKTVRIVLNVFSISLIALNIGLTFIRYGLTPI
jgi:membrane-associated protease RseP (regulator of RpoE activity)